MVEKVKSRKDVIKDALLKAINKFQSETERKFDIRRIIEPGGTRGLLRDELKGRLEHVERKIVYELFQDLKKEKILYHIAGVWWTRLK